MIGRLLPVTGVETRTCRSTARPGAGSTIELTERTGVGLDSLMVWIPFVGFAVGHSWAAAGRGLEASARLKRNVVPQPYGTSFRFVKPLPGRLGVRKPAVAS